MNLDLFYQTYLYCISSYVPFIESYYGVIGLMVGTVIAVVILFSGLIITYYKKLHPRLNMFTGLTFKQLFSYFLVYLQFIKLHQALKKKRKDRKLY